MLSHVVPKKNLKNCEMRDKRSPARITGWPPLAWIFRTTSIFQGLGERIRKPNTELYTRGSKVGHDNRFFRQNRIAAEIRRAGKIQALDAPKIGNVHCKPASASTRTKRPSLSPVVCSVFCTHHASTCFQVQETHVPRSPFHFSKIHVLCFSQQHLGC